MAMNKMSKEAWAANPSLGYEPNDLETILGPVFTLFRCFGINFHEPSDTNCRFLHQTAQIGWVVLTLGTCGFRLLVYFPFILTRTIADVENSKSTMHYLIEFLNYWIYILAVFIGSWCMARWSAAKLWRAIDDMLLHIPLSPEDTARCRKTSVQCIFGCLVALSLNLILSLSIEISLASPANRMALALLSVVYFYSFGSCALFISAGRIISIAFQTVSSQLELNCCPPSTNAAVVWNYQRQFGIACRAAEKFCSTFGFVLFATVSYTFIGFVNASYNLLKSYQNLPQGSDGGEDLYFVIPRTIKLTYMIVEHLFRLWLICHTADLIRSKALSLVPVLQSIRNDLYSRQGCNDESQEVHTFLLEVSETSPTFGVLGMFTLTKHIIISASKSLVRMKIVLALALLSCCAIPSVVGTRFVCYFPNWTYSRGGDGKFGVDNIDPFLCTDLVYSFAVLDGATYQIKIADDWGDIGNNGYASFVALKTRNSQLKTTIAIGGWNDSHDGTNKYSNMVANPANRKMFVDSVVAFLELYKFDGLDLDWEYPSGESDKAGFAELLKELRAALGTKLISVAVAANSTIIDLGYDVAVMAEKADYINVMAYDMHGPWEPQTDHHAPLYKRSWETVDNNIDFIVNHWISKGLPANKINLGIPLYGKSWILGESVEPEFLAKTKGDGPAGPLTGTPGFLGYHEICNSIHAEGWETVDDPEYLNGPYAFSASNPKSWVSYDDTKMAAKKTQYVIDNQLGGAMVWDISTDDFHNKCGGGANPLMTTISDMTMNAGSRFICYFPNWAYYRPGDGKYVVDDINATLCTDMVYAFAILDGKTYKIKEFEPEIDLGENKFYSKFVDLKKQNSKLKTTIAIGGWTDSHDGTTKYSDMVASSTNRRTFVDSVLAFLDKYKFDGLDIDWEYPSSASDKVGLAELMKELRAAFNLQTPKYSLTIAVGVNKTISDLGYDIPVLATTADYINIMAYDMHGPWEPLTDHHAPLYKRDWDTDATNNIDAVVQYWKDSGMPSSKLMLGIPLYGKSWTLDYTYTEDPTLPAPGLGPGAAGPLTGESGTLGYNEICNYVKNENWEVVVDPEFKIGPYASTPSVPMTWVGYDDPAMAQVKSRYVLDKGLGGAMVWDMSTDDFRNTCGDGPNPIMTNISRTVGVTTSTTTTSPAATTKTTTASTSTTTGETTTTTPTTPRPSTTKLSTWPRVTTERTTQATSSKTPFMPNDGHRIAGNSQQLIFLAFGFILINLVIYDVRIQI